MDLWLASTNPGKLRDFAYAATPGVTLAPLANLSQLPVPAEDEPTFAANVSTKAIAYSRHAPGQLVLADDSGLEVDALGGAPGVRSARFAEDRGFTTSRPLTTDLRNNLCLLDALGNTREADRGARYRCALALARDGEIVAISEGTLEGEILAVPRGTNGFGYDPLFLLPEEGLTMAELSPKARIEHSHRGQALRVLLAKLRLQFDSLA